MPLFRACISGVCGKQIIEKRRQRQMTLKVLTGNALKVIAIVAMTIDHLAWVGIETF